MSMFILISPTHRININILSFFKVSFHSIFYSYPAQPEEYYYHRSFVAIQGTKDRCLIIFSKLFLSLKRPSTTSS